MISPHEVMGVVDVVEHLSTVQDKVYDEPTVLVVHNVTGEQGGAPGAVLPCWLWVCVKALRVKAPQQQQQQQKLLHLLPVRRSLACSTTRAGLALAEVESTFVHNNSSSKRCGCCHQREFHLLCCNIRSAARPAPL